MTDIDKLLDRPEFPLSRKYDRDWVLDNQMGPNVLWLTEWLCETLELKPGMRVLDLGCGRAMSSIFLAKEFGVQVVAADLWMEPEDNWKRVMDADQQDRVCPIKAEAHDLPFAPGYFDAVVSLDAYQYFGTDELYVDYLTGFLRPGGQIGVVVVGLMRELPDGPPDCFTRPQSNGEVFWEASCRCFKTPDFWRKLWQGSDRIEGLAVDVLEDGWKHWRDFEVAIEKADKQIFPSCTEALEKDQGRTIGFIRLKANRSQAQGMNFYDPNLGAKVRSPTGA